MTSQKGSTGWFLLQAALARLFLLRHNLDDVDVSPEVFLFLAFPIHLLLFTGSERHFFCSSNIQLLRISSQNLVLPLWLLQPMHKAGVERTDVDELAGWLRKERMTPHSPWGHRTGMQGKGLVPAAFQGRTVG